MDLSRATLLVWNLMSCVRKNLLSTLTESRSVYYGSRSTRNSTITLYGPFLSWALYCEQTEVNKFVMLQVLPRVVHSINGVSRLSWIYIALINFYRRQSGRVVRCRTGNPEAMGSNSHFTTHWSFFSQYIRVQLRRHACIQPTGLPPASWGFNLGHL